MLLVQCLATLKREADHRLAEVTAKADQEVGQPAAATDSHEAGAGQVSGHDG